MHDETKKALKNRLQCIDIEIDQHQHMLENTKEAFENLKAQRDRTVALISSLRAEKEKIKDDLGAGAQ